MTVRVTYKHWKTEEELVCVGELIKNNLKSDRLIVRCPGNRFEDIIKETVISIEELDDK